MMKKCLAFVLKGGGARGALEVGALRALLEQGYQPDLLAGTSIGAVNAAGLAVWGVDRTGVERLELFFKKAANSKLLEQKAARITLRSLVRGLTRRRPPACRVSGLRISNMRSAD
jgi:NTE family protein